MIAAKVDAIERDVAEIKQKLDPVLTFVDECSGGRKALLMVLKITGSLIAIAGGMWALLKAGVLVR
jgi:hypothetical protein